MIYTGKKAKRSRNLSMDADNVVEIYSDQLTAKQLEQQSVTSLDKQGRCKKDVQEIKF